MSSPFPTSEKGFCLQIKTCIAVLSASEPSIGRSHICSIIVSVYQWKTIQPTWVSVIQSACTSVSLPAYRLQLYTTNFIQNSIIVINQMFPVWLDRTRYLKHFKLSLKNRKLWPTTPSAHHPLRFILVAVLTSVLRFWLLLKNLLGQTCTPDFLQVLLLWVSWDQDVLCFSTF